MRSFLFLAQKDYWNGLHRSLVARVLGEPLTTSESAVYAHRREIAVAVELFVSRQTNACVCLIEAPLIRTEDLVLARASLDSGWIAELLLSFPDVFFIFSAEATQEARRLLDAWGCPIGSFGTAAQMRILSERVREASVLSSDIFDPYGLRARFRAIALASDALETSADPKSALNSAINAERHCRFALSIDDEELFALVHGYACYASGLPTRPIWLRRQLANYLRDPHKINREAPAVVVSDWDLRFDDAVGADAGSAGGLRTADEAITARTELLRIVDPTGASLEPAPQITRREKLSVTLRSLVGLRRRASGVRQGPPLLVVSSASSTAIGEAARTGGDSTAQRVLRLRELDERWVRLMQKPVGGLFHLMESIAPPPEPDDIKSGKGTGHASALGQGRHSAPYRRKVVANRLITRAQHLLDQHPRGVVQLLHACVLAREAQLLLGRLARTTAFHALSIQYEAEVRLELSFLGFVGELDPRARLASLERAATALAPPPGAALDASFNNISINNFLVVTIDRLRRIYAEHDQVDAADACLELISKGQRALILEKGAQRRTVDKQATLLDRAGAIINFLGMAYFDAATKSGTSIRRWTIWLGMLMLLNLIILSLALWSNAWWTSLTGADQFSVCLRSVFYTLTGDDVHSLFATKTADANVGILASTVEVVFRMLTGFVHTGLLFALLYRRITRRAA